MARPTPLPLALALCVGALPSSPARADDWQVTRSAFDPRVLAPLKARLSSHPDDLGTLRRLISLYKAHRSVDQLQRELDERASSSGRPEDLLAAGHLRRERGQLDEARARYEQALAAVSSPPPAGKPGKPSLDRPALLLLLVDLDLRRAPPNTEAARPRLDEALAALPAGDARRQQALRKAADLAQLAQDFAAAERLYAELLRARPGGRGPSGGDEESLRQARADALVRAGRPKEALGELTTLAARKAGPDRAQALLRVGEVQEADKDDLGALATYKAALALLPQGHHLRHDLYDRVVGVHRRREDLPALLRAWEAEWPAPRRGFFEWDLLARLHDETGDTEKAIAAYRAALARSPHHIDARRRLIAVLERSGQSPDTVIAEYERLTQDAPGEARTYLELAERLDKAGQRQRALQILARAAARFPSDPSLHAALGDLYGRWGEVDLALREAELLVRIAPQDEGHIVNLGEIHWARGQKDKAEAVWRRLLTIGGGGGRTQGMARLADVYAEHGLMPQAIELYQKALKAEPQGPQNLQLRRGLALCQERLNRPREAMPLWEGIYFTKDAPRPLLNEARQHLATLVQKDTRARVQFQAWQVRLRNLIDRPQSLAPAALRDEAVPLALLLAETHLRLSRPADAERSLQGVAQALKGQKGLAPVYAEVLLQLVPIYRQQHRLPEAIAALKEAVALQPDRARELYAQLAELSLQTYRDDEAMRYAEQAVADAQGEMRLGAMLERKDDIERAMAAYRRALAKDERLFAAHMALARLHLQRGQPDDLKEAAARYREVARRAPQEELVLEAGRKAVDLHEYLGTLGDLVRDLLPLSHAYPQKPVYRKLLVSLYDRYATPLTLQARRGDAAARAELLRLGQSGLKPLTEALIDGDTGEQRIAVSLLGDLGNPSAAPALIKFADGGAAPLTGAPRPVQAAAMSSLLKPPSGSRLERGALIARGDANAILGALSAETIGLRSRPEIDLRVAALLQAGRLANPQNAPALLRLAAHEEKKIRLAALYGLLRLPRLGRAEVAALERALSDVSSDVQALACLGLGVIYAPGQGQAGAEPMPARVRGAMFGLIDRSARTEEGIGLLAAACVHGLGQAGQAQAVPLFLNLMREGSEELEAQAAWALGQVRSADRDGDRRAIEPLLRAALLKGGPVREAAAVALWDLGGAPRPVTWPEPDGDGLPAQGLPGLEVRRLLAALSPRQPSWPTGLQGAAPGSPVSAPIWAEEGGAILSILQEALAGHRDLALRALSDLLGAPDEAGPVHLGPLDAGAPAPVAAALLPLRRRLGPDLLPALRKLVAGEGGGGDSAVRGQAVLVLSRLAKLAPSLPAADEPTLAALEGAVRGDASLEVRRLAAEALVQVGGPRAAPALEALLQSQDRRLRLLGLQVLGGAGPGVRGAISEGVLRRAGQDADGYVREASGKLQVRP
jgi:tetratricopeptide (TPR) repeat protein